MCTVYCIGSHQQQHKILESTGALVHSADFANTYYHPSPVHIMRKNPVFDGRVHIDLSTYHSLDEDQREMLKGSGLIVNII